MMVVGIDPAARGTGITWAFNDDGKVQLLGNVTVKAPMDVKDRDVAAVLARRIEGVLASHVVLDTDPEPDRRIAVVEDPWQPRGGGMKGKSSDISHKYNGITLGVAVAVCVVAGFDTIAVPARAWKKHFGFHGTREEMQEQARADAPRQFPGYSFDSQNTLEAGLIIRWYANQRRLHDRVVGGTGPDRLW